MAEVESFHQSVAAVKPEKDAFRLGKSLKELKDLRSQLHYAADYCESSFLKSKQKDQVVENTKEYICRAVITVVDHLGSASANLDKIISQDKTIPEAELRLDCLSQRLLVCKEFSNKSALADLCWTPRLSRHHSQYLLAEVPKQGNPNYAEAKSGELKAGMNSSEVFNKLQNIFFKSSLIMLYRNGLKCKTPESNFRRRRESLAAPRWFGSHFTEALSFFRSSEGLKG